MKPIVRQGSSILTTLKRATCNWIILQVPIEKFELNKHMYSFLISKIYM